MRLNPFHILIANLPEDDELVDVTVSLLSNFRDTLKEHGVDLEHISQVFEVLEYLHENDAIQLNTNQDGTYTIQRKYYG